MLHGGISSLGAVYLGCKRWFGDISPREACFLGPYAAAERKPRLCNVVDCVGHDDGGANVFVSLALDVPVFATVARLGAGVEVDFLDRAHHLETTAPELFFQVYMKPAVPAMLAVNECLRRPLLGRREVLHVFGYAGSRTALQHCDVEANVLVVGSS